MHSWYFNPILAQIGPLQIHWYGLMYALAFLLAYFYLHYSSQGKSLPFHKDQKDTFLGLIIIGVLLGGRLGYVLFYNLGFYLANPFKIFAVWEGGMSFHGGLLGVALGTYLFAKKYRLNIWTLADSITSFAPLGILLGRIGNFINGELYGRVVHSGDFLSHFCLYFPNDPANCRYPSQLFEAFLEGLVLFLLLALIRKKTSKPGIISACFFFFYGLFRFLVEFFREPDAHIGYIFGWLTEGQILSGFMIIAGAIFLSHLMRQASKNRPTIL